MRTTVLAFLLAIAAVMAPPAQSQDTIRVQADGPPRWGPSVQLERLYSIGDRDPTFGAIGYFASMSDGRTFVYDEKDKQIRAFDATGKFLAKVGRLGDGPGEYRVLQGMEVLHDTMLVTWDVRNKRVSYFDRRGRYISSQMYLRTQSLFSAFKTFDVDDMGNVCFLAQGVPRVNGARIDHYDVFDALGSFVDSLRLPAVLQASGTTGRGTPEGYRTNFPATNVTAMHPRGGLVQATTTRYAVTVSVRGEKPRVIEHRHQPIVLRGDERAEWEAIARNIAANKPAPDPRVIQAALVPFPLPATKPAIRALSVGPEGRIWVDVYTVAQKHTAGGGSKELTWHELATYDVFERDGAFLGRIQLPAQSQLLGTRGNTLWVSTLTRDDEPIVVAYRIR